MGDDVVASEQGVTVAESTEPEGSAAVKHSQGFRGRRFQNHQRPNNQNANGNQPENTPDEEPSGRGVIEQPNRRRGGGVASQKPSSRYEYRRFRKPNTANKTSVTGRTGKGEGRNLGEVAEQPPGKGETQQENDTRKESRENAAGNETVTGAAQTTQPSTARKERKKPVDSSVKPAKAPRRRVCKYFLKEGSCYFGDRCRFLHEGSAQSGVGAVCPAPESRNPESPESRKKHQNLGISESQDVEGIRNSEKIPFRPRIIELTGDQKGSTTQLEAFKSETAYFKRRFPKALLEESENGTAITFDYDVTDPEWVFDVRCIRFSFLLPEGYPIDKGCVAVEDQQLPEPLVIHVEKTISEYLTARWEEFSARNAFRCIGKTLIKWIDRSIFDMFVVGLKKTKMVFEAESAGISLMLPSKPPQPQTSEQQDGDMQDGDIRGEKEGETVKDENNEDEGAVESAMRYLEEGEIDGGGMAERVDSGVNEPGSSGKPSESKTTIEVRVEWRDASANIASMSMPSLALTTRCVKCASTSFITCTPNRTVTATCLRCSNRQSMYMKGELVHEHSNVIARLEPKGCRPIDCVLLSSTVRFVCLNCNRESTAENLSYGVTHKTWCFLCHTKCEFDISTIRFAGNFHLIAKEDESMPKLKIAKKKKTEQSIAIVDGEPLPDNGTCKHYKKSYRWFRFPCCGKLYACDECHTENEQDHEMKLANRMVCGHCSKEQPYQKAKPCIRCNDNMTRVKTSFWEGGKGCRDVKLMSRNDGHKYNNSRVKTVSKKQAGNLAVKKKAAKEQ